MVEIQGQKIKIHYKGFNAKYDEWLDTAKDEPRIQEVGLLSGAEGAAKYSLKIKQELQDKETELKEKLRSYKSGGPPSLLDGSGWGLKPEVPEFDIKRVDWRKEEEKFERQLANKNFRII